MNTTRKDWSVRLPEALWAYRTAYKTILGMSPFRVVYGKLCHLPVELEHKSFWAVKRFNLNSDSSHLNRRLQICELEEIRRDAYNNSRLAKERMKLEHDRMVLRREFHSGQRVLLYNARLHLFPGKLQVKVDWPIYNKGSFPSWSNFAHQRKRWN